MASSISMIVIAVIVITVSRMSDRLRLNKQCVIFDLDFTNLLLTVQCGPVLRSKT